MKNKIIKAFYKILCLFGRHDFTLEKDFVVDGVKFSFDVCSRCGGIGKVCYKKTANEWIRGTNIKTGLLNESRGSFVPPSNALPPPPPAKTK